MTAREFSSEALAVAYAVESGGTVAAVPSAFDVTRTVWVVEVGA